MSQWSLADMPSLRGKTALVTGANRGLGRELATALAVAGARVIAGCRDTAKMDMAMTDIRRGHPHVDISAMAIDLADLASIRAFAARFKAAHAQLDIVVHNAAAIMVPKRQTRDGFEMHIGTNHLGPFALTGLLLDALRAAPQARVVSTGSLAHRLSSGLDLDDTHYARRPYKEMDAYGASKIAALSFTFELDRRLRQAGLPVLALAAHPGYTATNDDIGNVFMRLATRLFAQKPAVGALPALYAATAVDVRSGDYIGPSGFKELGGAPKRVTASDVTHDEAFGARLWRWSEMQTGVRYLDSDPDTMSPE